MLSIAQVPCGFSQSLMQLQKQKAKSEMQICFGVCENDFGLLLVQALAQCRLGQTCPSTPM